MGSFVSFAVMWESETPDPITFPFPLNNEYMNVGRFLSIEPNFSMIELPPPNTWKLHVCSE